MARDGDPPAVPALSATARVRHGAAALAALVLTTLVPRALLAHTGQPIEPHDLATAWTTDPVQLIGLALAGWMYGRGLVRLWRAAQPGRGVRRWEAASFAIGWLVLVVALVSPLHAMGEVLFSAHMVQHELLMVVAAPLLVLGRPLIPFVWAMSPRWRRITGSWSKTPAIRVPWRVLTHPMSAWLIYAVTLWVWHLPQLYQASLAHEWVHALQHVSFLGSALLFWWALLQGHDEAMASGAAILYVFTTMLHNGLLGALLTFATTVWYPAYYATTGPWGLTPLEDQQLAGLIMWIPAGISYLVAALVVLARWLRLAEWRDARSERDSAVASVIRP